MTIQLVDHADSGDIPRDLGVEPTRDLRHHMNRRDTTEELTQNLAHEIAGLPPRRRPENDATIETRIIEHPILNTWDMDETVIYNVADSLTSGRADLEGCVDLDGPQSPPPPLPPVPPAPTGYEGRHRHPDDLHAEPERRVSPWRMVTGVVAFGVAVYAGLLVAIWAVLG